jgi:signal-transduction protein with cAMP-binding, CBS, and nucleotidyltransferase domain
MICPDCRHDNIAGLDHCEHCGQSLSQIDQPQAKSGLQAAIMETPLRDLQPALALTVPPSDTVGRVIGLMREHRQGSVLIMDGDRLVGIFTERDIVNRLTARQVDIDHLPISEVMTRDPKALRDDHTLAFAMHRMAIGHYRHVPILVDGQPPRFVSVRGVLKYLHEHAGRT